MSPLEVSDRLSAEKLSGALADCTIGRRVLLLDQTTSTNDFLLGRLDAELPEGFVVFAEHQTAGRGQRGHGWASAARLGLWFSILLRPTLPMTESARLTSWLAGGIAKTIRAETDLEALVKPPNDVYIGGRKVAGVLVDTRAGVGSAYAAIAGVGVNLNHTLTDFPPELRARAGSVAMALGKQIDRQKFAVSLLRELDRGYLAIN
jgi:BirA family biotin operon repressor/biotin-[acetyl-CoA-carboxylase] ligase